MDWREHIHSDPAILDGNPVVRGTRLGAAFLRRLLAGGWTEEQVLASYPHLSRDALRAVESWANDAARHGSAP